MRVTIFLSAFLRNFFLCQGHILKKFTPSVQISLEFTKENTPHINIGEDIFIFIFLVKILSIWCLYTSMFIKLFLSSVYSVPILQCSPFRIAHKYFAKEKLVQKVEMPFHAKWANTFFLVHILILTVHWHIWSCLKQAWFRYWKFFYVMSLNGLYSLFF